MNGDGNFKMKCICAADNDYTKGLIYEVINGYWENDRGDEIGDDSIKTVANVNERSASVWELAEDEVSEPVKEELSVSKRMEKVANMLGLELNEEFNVILENGMPSSTNPHKFTECGLMNKITLLTNGIIGVLLTGKYKIEKLPWKPKDDDKVWYIFSNKSNSWCQYTYFYSNFGNHVALYKMGWLFRTEKEAEANKERVLAEMREVMENE